MSRIIITGSLILFFVSCIVCNSFGQDAKLWLMNGKQLSVKSYKINFDEVEEGVIAFTNLEGKQKKKYLDDVFSIIDADGSEQIVYKQDEFMGNILTPAQMRIYLQGFTDVLENYKVPAWVFIGGFASGIVGGILPQPNFDLGDFHGSVPVGVLVPSVYVGTVGAITPDVDLIESNMPNRINDEYYKMGVQDGVQKKRIKGGLIGGAIGFVAGALTLIAVSN